MAMFNSHAAAIPRGSPRCRLSGNPGAISTLFHAVRIHVAGPTGRVGGSRTKGRPTLDTPNCSITMENDQVMAMSVYNPHEVQVYLPVTSWSSVPQQVADLACWGTTFFVKDAENPQRRSDSDSGGM